MDREAALQQIAEIDRQLNAEYDKNRAPKGSGNPFKPFPWGPWVFALVILAYGAFGGMIETDFHGRFGGYFVIVGIVLLVLALIRTLFWVFTRGGKSNREYLNQTEHLRELQAQRQELQKVVSGQKSRQ